MTSVAGEELAELLGTRTVMRACDRNRIPRVEASASWNLRQLVDRVPRHDLVRHLTTSPSRASGAVLPRVEADSAQHLFSLARKESSRDELSKLREFCAVCPKGSVQTLREATTSRPGPEYGEWRIGVALTRGER